MALTTTMSAARTLPYLLSALLVAACATEPASDVASEDDLPVGDLSGDDGKADGYWGFATECKDIPYLPPLTDPEIIISIDGLTLHLVDRAGDYDRVFSVGVGTIDKSTTSMTYGESHTMYPVLATGGSDFTIKTTDNWNFNPCRIWWTDSSTGQRLPVFAGLPFMRWQWGYGIHGPITNYRAANGGRLDRGYVSHGCIRMEAADVVEVYALISATAEVPVHVQREAERLTSGARTDVSERWIGSECARDSDCSYDGGLCKANPYSGRSFCTKSCDRYCPDRTGYPTTFCVADPDAADQGMCVVKESSQNFDCRPYDHLAPMWQTRFSQPSVGAEVCVPGSRGWIGDHCFSDIDCQDGNSCAGSSTNAGAPGICTQSCTRYCPDQTGTPSTFCVNEAELGGATCVRQCSPDSNASECPADSQCVARDRNGQPGVTRTVCLPD